jgi:predicted amidophosphoribosyltransferase
MKKRDLIELTDAVTGGLVPMAPDADDVCPLCRAGKGPRQATCSSCRSTTQQVHYPIDTVIPVSYYVKPEEGEQSGLFRDAVHGYKESSDPAERAVLAPIVGGIMARYLLEHGDALADTFGPWDEVVAVPSTRSAPPSALARVLNEEFSNLVSAPVELLTNGSGEMGFVRASEAGFRTTADVSGAQILLVDDTFTTGARMQSAAHALQAAGARVIVGMTVARKIRVNQQYKSVDLWRRQHAKAFSFEEPPWWAKD